MYESLASRPLRLPVHAAISQPSSTARETLPLPSAVNYAQSLSVSSCELTRRSGWATGVFNSWVLETPFFLRRSAASRNALLVLSLIPPYRTRPGFSVSSDKQRSNYYKNFSFYNSREMQLRNALLSKSYIASAPYILRRSRKLSVTPLLRKLRQSCTHRAVARATGSLNPLLYTSLIITASLGALVAHPTRLSGRCRRLIRLKRAFAPIRQSRGVRKRRGAGTKIILKPTKKLRFKVFARRWVSWKRRKYRRRLRKVGRFLR